MKVIYNVKLTQIKEIELKLLIYKVVVKGQHRQITSPYTNQIADTEGNMLNTEEIIFVNYQYSGT